MRARDCVGVVVLCLLLSACGATPQTGEPTSGLETLDFRQVVNSAKEKVFPAVVFIKCIRETHEAGKKMSLGVSGSGVLISPSGEALTNWHVVDKAIETRCLLRDGRAMEAKVVGTDKDVDLALLQLKVPADAGALPHAVLGDSGRLKEGDFVMAMGAPWGLARSVSIGIVSCARRYLPERSEYSSWLQTDAAISPGNSGGPLVNTDGEIVGITTLAALIGGDMGFAVPSDTVRRVLPQLRELGRIGWSWTGLQLQPLKDFDRNIYFDATEGVIVAATDPESPARRAGVESRDRILRINGVATNAMTDEDLPAIRALLGALPMGQPAQLELVRDEALLNIQVTPRQKGKVEGEELDCPRWDLTVKAINQFDNPDLYFYLNKGVFVFGIKWPGNAQDAGLREKDIILKIEGQEVGTLEDVKRIHAATLAAIETKHRVVFAVLRNGLQRQFVLDFLRDYERE